MKILNLYACLGGNRYKWGDEHEIIAIELDPELARLYQERFPNDTVIVTDAHQYLLDHYKKFDFIWSSPPCPTHSRVRHSQKEKNKPEYPSMILYEEIIFLKHHFEGKYCVENVIPYYEPLIQAKKRGRHLYWTNFNLPNDLNERKPIGICGNDTEHEEVEKLSKLHSYDFWKYKNEVKGKQRIVKIARNLVDYEAGKTILDTAMGVITDQNKEQIKLNF